MSIRLLYLNTHRLSAYTWRQGHLHLEDAFDNNEEGFRLFADYLADRRGSQYAMLANVAEEGHVLESIPFLHGKDRRTLIARKFGQHFLGTPLATAVSLGYEKTQRKNEKLLLSALTNPANFEPWLRRIKDADIALSGIYTAAQLGGQLLGKLGQTSNRCLLLTLQDSTIRESYLVDGHAHFSRMAPLSDSSIAGIAGAFVAESGKLHQYLIGQRLIGRDESLPAYIVAHPQTIPAIEKICPEHGPLNYNLIDSHVAAQKLKLHTHPGDNRSDMLLLHLLAISPPRQQFANDAHRHHFRLAQIRHALIATGLVALLGSVLFAAKGTYDAQNLREEASALRTTEADLNRRYLEISATFPQLGVDNETLRRVTNRYADLIAQQRQPGASYRMVSRVLDRMPAITLESIDWKNGQNFRLTVGSSREHAETTTVRGTIRLERATTRQILAMFDQFVDALKADPAYTVNILQRPFDIESGQSLRGGDSLEGETQARQFAVEIVRGNAP